MKTALLLFLALPLPQQPPPQPPQTTSSATQASSEYVVGPQDKLAINVIPDVFSDGKVTVDADGNIQYLAIGRIKVVGLTARQIADKVKELLIAKGQHTNPTVTVEVVEFRSQTVYVQGEGVQRGGSFRLEGNDTLQSVIFRAGSFTAKSGSTVTISRSPAAPGAKRSVIEIPRRDIEQNTGTAVTFRLQDGDIVTVQEAGRVIVQGEVKVPGPYDITDDTKIVLDFINLAGGFTAKANKGNIEITRTINGKPTQVKVNKDLTTPVQPNDVIIVKIRRW